MTAQRPLAADPLPCTELLPRMERIHRTWLDQVRREMACIRETHPDFWNRWAVVRYMEDDFALVLARASALGAVLRRYLTPEQAAALTRREETFESLRRRLDALGRRRGTAAEFVATAEQLLAALDAWCGEMRDLLGARPGLARTEAVRSALDALEAVLLGILAAGHDRDGGDR